MIFNTYILPLLLHGSETWTVGVRFKTKIAGAYTRVVRFVRGYRVFDYASRVRNEVLFNGFKRIEVELLKRRLRFAGHVARSGDTPAAALLFAKNRVKRQGAPRLTYPKQLLKDMTPRPSRSPLQGEGVQPQTYAELFLVMQDRDLWNQKVEFLAKAEMQALRYPKQVERAHILPLGTGRGRKRERSGVTQAALAARARYSLKRISQLVCPFPPCMRKGCSVHCTRCEQLLSLHPDSVYLRCMLCSRSDASECVGWTRVHAEQRADAYVCRDCTRVKRDLVV
eukprot:TRINITY_DN7196_c0_g1_i10.p1 TRINITY_DN7196_c0_g1~~TRINITY_DN7196_c0_g1_i10.p1  ORF type:complete len:282 (+),score=53.32 TRINITY_DN7196_c0_g1_i10:321-1166(+)